jgi:hypothetical protein
MRSAEKREDALGFAGQLQEEVVVGGEVVPAWDANLKKTESSRGVYVSRLRKRRLAEWTS